MECGSFYEIYDDGSKNTNLKEIGELLNIQVSRRNKAILEVSRNNLEMAGFPSYTLKKFVSILIDNMYTVVIVSQVTPPPNPQRKVTDIVSPGTYIGEDIGKESNYLMSIFIEENPEFKSSNINLTIGASWIDLGTGKTYVMETTSKANDILYPLDELYRIIVSYNPSEVIISGKLSKACASISQYLTYEKIVSYLDLEGKCIHHEFHKYDNYIRQISYQEEVLKHVYKDTGMLRGIEYINMEMQPIGLVSFIRLLQFVNNHNEAILEKIRRPLILNESNSLTLSYNSVKQLDLIPQTISVRGGRTTSLLDLLNNCKTAVGRRYFKERLLNPLTNVIELQVCYDTIEKLLHDKLYMKLESDLTSIYDTERLFRRIDILTLQPFELSNLMTSLWSLLNICNILKEQQCLQENTYLIKSSQYIQEINTFLNNTINEEVLSKFNYDNICATIFKPGKYKEIDKLHNEVQTCKRFFEEFVVKLNALHNGNEVIFKLENNEREGYYINITNKRYNDFLRNNKSKLIVVVKHEIRISELVSKSVSSSSTSVKVIHPIFQEYNNKLDVLEPKLKREVTSNFKEFLKETSTITSQFAQDICKVLSLIDYFYACAYNASIYRYRKPQIIDNQNGKSYIKVKAIRHPLIERLSCDTQYVSNDIAIGIDEMDGVLLYGLNSSGKSSLMKSIGIATVMAQAGMYVACDELEFFPYQYIFTRILSSDDIFKGQSTFTKEMLELRGILKRANHNSLVIGDELCSGTESISALAIVSSGVCNLASKHTSFIFATHLHDLINIDEIRELDNVKAFHLSVIYDTTKKQLIYDRKLKPGNGSTLYGLEVCKSLDLEDDFLLMANRIRKKLIGKDGDIVASTSRSTYNKDVFMQYCKVCGEKATEVHHISQQKYADEKGYIDTFHKNDKFNLVSLCDTCHNNVHHGNLDIKGYKQTSDGIVLDFEKQTSNSDVYNEIKEFVKQIITNDIAWKRKDVIDKVQSQYSHTNMTTYRIDKIIKELKKS
jgi:DNA mismatch repair protein MutS